MRKLAAAIMVALFILPVLSLVGTAQTSQLIFVGPIYAENSTVIEGETTTIYVNITNYAPFPQVGVHVALFDNMMLVGERTLNLTANESITIGFQYNATRGLHNFVALGQTGTGELLAPFTVLINVNSSVQVTEFSADNETPVDGDSVIMTVTLFNNNISPLQNLTLRVEQPFLFGAFFQNLEVKEIFNISGFDMGPMETRTFQVQWNSTYGNYTFLARVSQGTPHGIDDVAIHTIAIDVENRYHDPLVTILGISTVIVAFFAIAFLPSFGFLFRRREGRVGKKEEPEGDEPDDTQT